MPYSMVWIGNSALRVGERSDDSSKSYVIEHAFGAFRCRNVGGIVFHSPFTIMKVLMSLSFSCFTPKKVLMSPSFSCFTPKSIMISPSFSIFTSKIVLISSSFCILITTVIAISLSFLYFTSKIIVISLSLSYFPFPKIGRGGRRFHFLRLGLRLSWVTINDKIGRLCCKM